MELTFRAVSEAEPGPEWAGLFHAYWPHYRRWWAREGVSTRPSYLASAGRSSATCPSSSASTTGSASWRAAATRRRASSRSGARRPISPPAARRSGRGPSRCSSATTTTTPHAFDALVLRTAMAGPPRHRQLGRDVGARRRHERCGARRLAHLRRPARGRRGLRRAADPALCAADLRDGRTGGQGARPAADAYELQRHRASTRGGASSPPTCRPTAAPS